MVHISGQYFINKEQGNIKKKGERWGFIDKSGTPVINPLYKDVKPFSSGLAAVKNEQNLWGYIDSKGIEQIPAQFSSAESFSKERHAVVRSDKSGLFQVIDAKGDTLWTIECDALISDGNTFRIKKIKMGVVRQQRKHIYRTTIRRQ